MEIGVAAFALLLAGYALVANRLDKLSIGPALAFVAVGLVLGPVVLDVLPVRGRPGRAARLRPSRVLSRVAVARRLDARVVRRMAA